MEKEFIPYEQALALKELGFDEKCLAFYDPTNEKLGIVGNPLNYNFISDIPEILKIKNPKPRDISAPLYQQAFRWFREKYKLKGFISPVEYLDGTDDTYHWCIYNECNSGYDQLTNEQAELECLKKLIKIVKEKK